MTERVGFIGLGIMGRGMARNVLKAEFELRVWNRTASRMERVERKPALSRVRTRRKSPPAAIS